MNDGIKLIIAGSRNMSFHDTYQGFEWIIQTLDLNISEIVCGEARGPDSHGKEIAKVMNIHVRSFPAQWDIYGKKAGMLRNIEMADYADTALVIWDGISNGSRNMIHEMKKRHKPCYIYPVLVKKSYEK